MANLIRSLTRKQLPNRNISALSRHNPFLSSGSSLDQNLSSGFGLFGDGVGLNPRNEGFRVNEKVTHLKSLGFDPFFSSRFGLSREESKLGNVVGFEFGLNTSDKGFIGNDEVDQMKRLDLDPFLSAGSYLDSNLASGFGLFWRESKCGDGVGFGLNPGNEGLRVEEEVGHSKMIELDSFLSTGSFLDPGSTHGFGLAEVIGFSKDVVEDPGMMWADSVKKKRKKKMNKHKYKKLRKRLRRKTKT